MNAFIGFWIGAASETEKWTAVRSRELLREVMDGSLTEEVDEEYGVSFPATGVRILRIGLISPSGWITRGNG